ncbi:glycosyltransferase family 2 protein [Hyphobacterium sp. CCMP332]|nr:glycosyltransferase family 2 protein [Hyphobacterium sp. CCMP332]
MIFSIIIPAYNESKYLESTLKNLTKVFSDIELKQSDWEVIVCDNNSTDNTRAIAEDNGAKVVFEPDNQISKARNKGAEVAEGDWLIFVDADSYPNKGLIKELLLVIDSNKYIGCGTTIEVIDGTLFNKLRLERMNPFYRLFKLSGGAFILCKKDAFIEINGFSSNLYAYEEIDFVIRLKKYGKKKNKKFSVLSTYPVLTSGRKGEYNLRSMLRLFVSGFIAPILLLLNYILPKRFVKLIGNKMLTYWYSDRK